MVPAYHRKMTRWVTNCRRLAELLEGVCSNLDYRRPWHRHVVLQHGLAHFARIYTPKLVGALLRAMRDELFEQGEVSAVDMHSAGPVPEEPLVPAGEWDAYWDDVNGGYLDPVLVRAARAEERKWMKQENIYTIVPLQQC